MIPKAIKIKAEYFNSRIKDIKLRWNIQDQITLKEFFGTLILGEI